MKNLNLQIKSEEKRKDKEKNKDVNRKSATANNNLPNQYIGFKISTSIDCIFK